MKTNKLLIFLIQISIVLLIFTLYLFTITNEIELKTAIQLLSIIFLISIIWALWSWNFLTHSFFDPYVLFFVASVLFNGGVILLQLVAFDDSRFIKEYGILSPDINLDLKLKTILFISLGLALFHLGAILSFNLKNKIPKRKFKYTISYSEIDVLHVGYIFLFISVIPTLIVLSDAISVVNSFGYFALYQQDVSTGLGAIPTILTNLLIPATIFILIGSKKKKKHVRLSFSIIVLYSLIMFFLGYRSHAVLPLIAYFWVWHRIINKIPKSILLSVSFIILFIVFPLISMTRNLSGAYRLNFDFLFAAFFSIDNPMVKILYEMGLSMMTVAHTIDLVPATKSFEMGSSYFYSLLTIIPNIFGGLHPAAVHGSPSGWITFAVAPKFGEIGGGLGFSYLAEAYLNFGWIGGFIFLTCFGYIVGKLAVYTFKIESLSTFALVASFLSFFLKYSRADMFSVVRPLLWYSFMPFIAIYFYVLIKNYYYHFLIPVIEHTCKEL